MSQIADLNGRLVSRAERVTVAELGLVETTPTGHHGDALQSSAVVVRLTWDGSPAFPYIHGHFSTNGSREVTVVVNLHTAALRLLSHRLAAHHLWGV